MGAIFSRIWGVSFRRITLRTYALPMQEGKQASLAADFSITQFKHIGRLLMVHGRNSYKRSAALGQFVMHRGMIISTMQVTDLNMFMLLVLNMEGLEWNVSYLSLFAGSVFLHFLLCISPFVPGFSHGWVCGCLYFFCNCFHLCVQYVHASKHEKVSPFLLMHWYSVLY